MKRIRIIYVTWAPLIYGGSRSLFTLLEEVKNFGIEPIVVINKDDEKCSELDRLGIKYCIISYSFALYPKCIKVKDFFTFPIRLLKILIQNFLAVNKLVKKARVFNADIIHSNYGPIDIGYRAAKKLGISHVWHIREYQDLDFDMHPLFTKKGFEKRLKEKINYPISITKGIFNYFAMEGNARVIYCGMMKANQARFNSQKEKYFLYAGLVSEKKGFSILCDSFIEFSKKNSDYQLYVAGTASDLQYMKKIEEKLESKNYKSNIKFLGFREDVYDLMYNATALIVPSLNEGFGRITAEAMFNGCLVIGNNAAGTKEQFENGPDIGIAYNGQEELTKTLGIIAQNGIESYFDMILRGQKTAVMLYSTEKHLDSIIKLYLSITEQ
jgi:L-malate glycosyltransferase